MMWPSPDDGYFPFHGAAGRGDDLDARLARQVRQRLGAREPGVRIQVQNGVAVLSGTVESAEVRRAAVRAARSVPGVRDVCNAMHVTADPGSAAPTGAAEPDDDRVFAEIVAALLAPESPRLPRRRLLAPPVLGCTVVMVVTIAWTLASIAVLATLGIGAAIACQAVAVIIATGCRRARRHHRMEAGGPG